MSCVWPVRGSQNCTPRSLEPDMTHWASGVRATERTKSWMENGNGQLGVTGADAAPREKLTLWPSKVLTQRPPLGPVLGTPRAVANSHGGGGGAGRPRAGAGP